MASSAKPQYTIAMVAGETSGDLLGAAFMKAWLERFPHTRFVGVGGPAMKALGFESLHDMEDLTAFGLIEPIKRLPKISKIFNALVRYFKENPPDCFIGVDFKEFNFRLEKKLKKSGIKTVQYVGPTVWAWRPKRILTVKKAADLVLLLFPFECAIYAEHQIPAVCVGHPFADEIPLETDTLAAKQALGLKPHHPVLALLPGSRRSEIQHLAAPFALAAEKLKRLNPTLQVIAAQTPTHAETCQALFNRSTKNKPITIFTEQARTVMTAADAILLSSGTATLEALLLKKPMVVAYRVNRCIGWIARKLIKLKHIALPNILAGRLLVHECLQSDVTPANLAKAVGPLLDQSADKQAMITEYHHLHQSLKKDASATAVSAVASLINQKGQS